MHVAKSRAEALATGANRYMGNPCYLGHPGVRFTKNYTCVTCHYTRHMAPSAKAIAKLFDELKQQAAENAPV